jgi:tetratricopeptide (TPR) repeat protein
MMFPDKPLVFDYGVLFGLTVAGAVVGGLLGFLFGIPRLLQANNGVPPNASAAPRAGSVPAAPTPATATSSPSSRAFAGNSNLEEISDWLTKIIVGVSLVQAGTIYTKVLELAKWFKDAIPQSQGADIMFVLVLISALIGGFLFLYLETRTRVMWLFTNTEAAITPERILDEPAIRTALQMPIGVRARTTALSSDDEELLDVPYEVLHSGDQFAAWGSAQARAGNYQAASQALRAAIAKEPGNTDYLVRLSDVLERQGSSDEARKLIAEVEQKQGDDLALLKRDFLEALYLDAPGRFEKALPISRRLLARRDGARDPFVHLWTAAAEGQRYLWLSNNNGTEVEKKNAREGALTAARKVVELAPDPKSSVRVLLQNMLNPTREGAAAEDDDLEVFKDDPAFIRVINGPN